MCQNNGARWTFWSYSTYIIQGSLSLSANLAELGSTNIFKQQSKMYDLKVYCIGRELMT